MARKNPIGKITQEFTKGQHGKNNRRQSAMAEFRTDGICFQHGSREPCPYCKLVASIRAAKSLPQPAADPQSPSQVDSHNHGPDSTNSRTDTVGERINNG